MSPDISALFSNVWSIFLVVLFFGGTIFVHELGHFLAARRRGVHVERFSIGFGPKIFSWKGRDGVEYRLSWIPLGGYVLLPQLADLGPVEGSTTTDVSKLPPLSYATKMIVFAAGAAFNVLFAFVLACILWAVGVTVREEEQSTRIGFVHPTIELSPGQSVPGPAFTAGLRDNDVILEVDGKSVSSFMDIANLIALGGGRDASKRPQVDITYNRAGVRQTTSVLPELAGPEKVREIGIEPAVKVTVASLVAGSPAEAAGVKAGDIALALDGATISYTGFISERLRKSEGRPVELKLLRNQEELVLQLQPKLMPDPETKAETYRLGMVLRGAYTTKKVHVSPWKQIQQQLLFTARNIGSLVNPHTDVGLSKMAGPVGIARIFHSAAESGMAAVLWFTILININLAVFNLLPIPVLDGGQMLFATIARLRGRALPMSFVATTQGVFMVLILMMFVYITIYGDVRRIVQDKRAERAELVVPAKSPK
jgi:regulator of sigma E protease